MRDAHNPNSGVKIGGENVSVLLYADDAVFISDTAKGLQDIVDQFDTACEPKSRRINAGKTKVLVFGNTEQRTQCDIYLRGECLEQVNDFVYLGSLFSRDGIIDREIERRVNAGRRVVGVMNGIARNKGLSRKARLAIYNGMLVLTLM